MALVAALPGFAMTKQQRIIAVIEGAGGPVKAAQLAGLSRTTLRNWRQDGADPPLGAIYPLCIEAKVSLDWVETGYQFRPDLVSGLADAAIDFNTPEGYVRLRPLRPEVESAPGGQQVERWDPSPIGVSAEWLWKSEGLNAESAAYLFAADDGVAPIAPRGALAIVDTRPSRPKAGFYAVDLEGELVIRRLNRLPGGGAELVADTMPSWRYPLDPGGPPVHRVVWTGHAL